MVEFTYEAIWSWSFVCWVFKITDLISLLAICLFLFSISFWFSLWRLYLSKNLSIYSRLSIFWCTVACSTFSWFLWYPLLLHFFSYLILLIWGLSLFFRADILNLGFVESPQDISNYESSKSIWTLSEDAHIHISRKGFMAFISF